MLNTTDTTNLSASRDLPTSGDPLKDVGGLTLAFMVLIGLAVLAFLGSEAWLAYKVPVSEQDFHDASWLFSFAPSDYLSHVLGVGLAVVTLMMGLFMGVARNSPIPALTGLVAALLMHVATAPSVQIRAGVADGSVKIGCVVWKSQECRAMLGVPLAGAPSMYLPREIADRTGEVYAPWYLEARTKETSLPYVGLGFLGAPYYAFHTDELNARLNAQRAEVAKFRAENPIHRS